MFFLSFFLFFFSFLELSGLVNFIGVEWDGMEEETCCVAWDSVNFYGAVCVVFVFVFPLAAWDRLSPVSRSSQQNKHYN